MNKLIFDSCDVMLPKIDCYEKWAVIACDQFTSEPQYWENVKNYIDKEYSTFNLILPEAYLSKDNREYIRRIHSEMHKYLSDDIFTVYKDSFIYIERTMRDGEIRPGILGKIDLEEYSFDKNSHAFVRPTEETVIERIPSRKSVREGAPIELPHIILFYDDKENKIINSIANIKDRLKLLYDFDLMMSGGHISGYLLQKSDASLLKELIIEYQNRNENKLLYAVGDGNHSLATAKSCWEDIKKNLKDDEKENHPSRYAMVEMVNINDNTQKFEPIHRIVAKTNPIKLIRDIDKKIGQSNGFPIKWYSRGDSGVVYIKVNSDELPLSVFQKELDEWLKENKGEIDYIHGDDNLISLTKNDDCVGFIMPTIKNDLFFEYIDKVGVLPRKTFSIGHAEEKRYYLEVRKLFDK